MIYLIVLRVKNLLHSSKGFFTNFEYTTFFSCLNKRNISYGRSISIKQLWLEIIENNGVQSQTVLYILLLYITWTDFEHNFYQLFRVRVVLSRWTFYKKCFFCWDTKKMLYIQNWLTIPSTTWESIDFFPKTHANTSFYFAILLRQLWKDTHYAPMTIR